MHYPLLAHSLRPLIIYFDIDNVLADIFIPWLAFYNRDYNDNLTVDSIKTWAIEKYVKPECGPKIRNYLTHPLLYAYTKPIPGYDNVIRQLRDWGHKIYFASAYSPSTADAKIDWMQKWVPDFDIEQLILVNNKGLLIGDVLIDDGPHNLAVFTGKTVRFVAAYNVGVPAHGHIRTWEHGLDGIEQALRNENKIVVD